MPRVISVGECMVEFSRRPDGAWNQGFAGDTMNVAWAMRALLAKDDWTVGYATRLGGDGFSQRMAAFLEDAGIDTTLVARDAARLPGLYTIETDASGERSFTYWRSQSAARRLMADGDRLARAFSGAALVYLSGITLAILPAEDRQRLIDALGLRGQRPFTVAFDPNIRPALWESQTAIRETITAMAGVADTVLPTFGDEADVFGDASPEATRTRYGALGCAEVVVKNGTRPTLWHAEGRDSAAPVARPVKPTDTTGAGDSFNGAYLARRLCGDAPAAAIAAAQAVSAEVVGVRGALAAQSDLRAAAAGVLEQTAP